jgi:hypothetical protein
VAGDVVLEAITGSLFLCGAQVPQIKVTSTGVNTYGTGLLQTGSFILKPASDFADLFVLKTAASVACVDFTSSGTPRLAWLNGTDAYWFTDSAATNSARIVGSTGVISAGSQLYPGSGTAAAPVIQAAAGFLGGNGAPSNTLGNNGDYYFRGDGTHGAANLIWHKEAGAWVNIL